MAVPSYTTDLTDIGTMNGIGDTVGEFVNMAIGGDPDPGDTDYFIQGTGCHTAAQKDSAGLQSIAFDYGSNITISADECIFMWQVMLAGNAIESFANGGYRLVAGSDLTNWEAWRTGGDDFGRNPYGGWQNVAVDPTFNSSTPDYSNGTAAGWRWFGSGVNMTSELFKGNLHGLDCMRYGRGEIIVTGGQTANYSTFVGMASTNDHIDARWGLFQAEGTGYLWKGLMSLGTTALSVDFVDSNRNITIDDTPRTYTDFNKIEINHPGSYVVWTGINITTLNSSALSIGSLEVTDSTASVEFNLCTFTDMGVFLFELSCVLNDITFRRCGQVTQGGGIFDGCIFEESDTEVSLLVDDLDNIDNCDFTSDGSNHAIKLTEEHAGGTYTLTGCTYNDYAGIDGDTGNEVIFNDSTGHVIINIIDGDVPTIRNGLGATTALPTSVSLTMTVKDTAGDPIDGAFAYIDDDNQTPFIMNTTTSALGVATVQHTGGAAPGSTWRVRKYGYKPYTQTVDIAGSDISIPVTLISDPQQT